MSELYELGESGGDYIAHTKDGKNYRAGQPFKLDHLSPDVIKMLVDTKKVKKHDSKAKK